MYYFLIFGALKDDKISKIVNKQFLSRRGVCSLKETKCAIIRLIYLGLMNLAIYDFKIIENKNNKI